MNRYRRELTWFVIRTISTALVLVSACYVWGRMERSVQPPERTYVGTYHCLNCGAEMVLYTNVED